MGRRGKTEFAMLAGLQKALAIRVLGLGLELGAGPPLTPINEHTRV